jgi:hypothetical protein
MAQISHYPILQAVLAEDYVRFTDLLMSNRLRPKPHKAHYLRREGGRQSVTLVNSYYIMPLVVRVRQSSPIDV